MPIFPVLALPVLSPISFHLRGLATTVGGGEAPYRLDHGRLVASLYVGGRVDVSF